MDIYDDINIDIDILDKTKKTASTKDIECINYDNYNEKTLKQMIFIYNALENGWKICKKKEHYIFTKKHKNKKEVIKHNYLAKFIEENTNLKNILSKLIN